MNRQKFIDCKPLKNFLLLDIANCGERDYNDFMKVNVFSTQCGTFKIFVLLRFYMKSILEILEVQNVPFYHF